MTARYLLRFDDLCPTMDQARWRRMKVLVARHKLRPILAVVPQNRDPELMIDPPDADFWSEMRQHQAAGATIGLHGYRHRCEAKGRSLIPLHKRSEFAGISRAHQREWVRAGMGILRAEQLEPRIWVAPRHGFDRVTLEVLRDEGIELVSDGFAKGPFVSHGVTWIPQQIWRPVEKSSGLWTICVHANSAAERAFTELEEFAEKFAEQFISVEEVVEEWPVRERTLGDKWFHAQMLWRAGLRSRRRVS